MKVRGYKRGEWSKAVFNPIITSSQLHANHSFNLLFRISQKSLGCANSGWRCNNILNRVPPQALKFFKPLQHFDQQCLDQAIFEFSIVIIVIIIIMSLPNTLNDEPRFAKTGKKGGWHLDKNWKYYLSSWLGIFSTKTGNIWMKSGNIILHTVWTVVLFMF